MSLAIGCTLPDGALVMADSRMWLERLEGGLVCVAAEDFESLPPVDRSALEFQS